MGCARRFLPPLLCGGSSICVLKCERRLWGRSYALWSTGHRCVYAGGRKPPREGVRRFARARRQVFSKGGVRDSHEGERRRHGLGSQFSTASRESGPGRTRPRQTTPVDHGARVRQSVFSPSKLAPLKTRSPYGFEREREREREGARARARVEFGAARPHCPSQSSHCWPRRHSGPGGKCACCPLRERRSWAESQLRVGKSVAAPNVQMGQLQRSSCG